MEVSDQLPEGWEWRQIGDIILDAQAGFSSGQKDVPGGIPHLRMNNITSECTLDLSELRTVPPELAKARHYLRPDDVLVCHTNSVKLVGKTALYDATGGERAFSNHLTRLRVKPNVIHPQWLWRGLTVLWRDRYFETRCKKWVNQATIERDVLLAAPIPLPPLSEQQRLVEKIERLLAQSMTSREALDRIPPLLKRFRQAVLAKAFRGELTERDPNDEPGSVLLERIREERRRKWEEDLRARGKDTRKAKYVEPASAATSGLPELPEGWAWATLGSLSWAADYGTSVKCGYATGGPPVLRIPNIVEGRLDLRDLKYAEGTHDLGSSKALAPGDFLIVRSNGSIELLGRAASVEMPFSTPHYFASYIIRYRVVDGSCLSWLSALWDTPLMRRQIEERGATTAGQLNLSIKRLDDVFVPMAPLREQKAILAKVGPVLERGTLIGRALAKARLQAGHVDQAVLARAFRGEL